jgi:hypothetical protein
MSSVALEKTRPPNETAEAPREEPTTFGTLVDGRFISIATIAIRNGSDPRDDFLSLTSQALSELSTKFSDLHVEVRTSGQRSSKQISDPSLAIANSVLDHEVGLPCSGDTAQLLREMQRAMFPGGITAGIEEATLHNSSLPKTLSENERRAEGDFYSTLKECELPREQYERWIHRHKAEFGCNQCELYEGAWLQITFAHLKQLAQKQPDLIVMTRNEDIPLSPSKRWESTTVKTALFTEKERRKDGSRGKLSKFYVFCADPEAALEISLQKPRISHSALSILDRAQSRKTVQYLMVAGGMVAAALSSIFQDAVKQNVKKIIDAANPPPVVKELDPSESPRQLMSSRPIEPETSTVRTADERPFAPFNPQDRFKNPLR